MFQAPNPSPFIAGEGWGTTPWPLVGQAGTSPCAGLCPHNVPLCFQGKAQQLRRGGDLRESAKQFQRALQVCGLARVAEVGPDSGGAGLRCEVRATPDGGCTDGEDRGEHS